jgi:predicted O-methyltransferase YrrM
LKSKLFATHGMDAKRMRPPVGPSGRIRRGPKPPRILDGSWGRFLARTARGLPLRIARRSPWKDVGLDLVGEFRGVRTVARLRRRPEWLAADRTAREFLREHMRSSISFSSRWALLEYAIRKARPVGDFLEFGVYRGSSLRYIARSVGPGARVIGFDSFLGLPETWAAGGVVVPRGSFQPRAIPSPPPNATLVAGWFEETVPRFVAQEAPSPSFVHIDSDLYSSARTVLENLGPMMRPGTVIVFDEFLGFPGWAEGEARALREAEAKFGWELEYFGFVDDKVGVSLGPVPQ